MPANTYSSKINQFLSVQSHISISVLARTFASASSPYPKHYIYNFPQAPVKNKRASTHLNIVLYHYTRSTTPQGTYLAQRVEQSKVTIVRLSLGYKPWPCQAVPEPVALPLCALPPYPPQGTHRSLMDGWCRSRPNPVETQTVTSQC